jgi:formamidopyrimidine-DNA glycosylase
VPEGVECQLIAKQLHNALSGTNLVSIEVVGGRYQKVPPTNLNLLSNDLPQKISSVRCKGKFIWFDLDKYYIWNTLGMTGGWSKEQTVHSAIKLTTNKLVVYFNDPRHFGTIKICNDRIEMEKKLQSIGPDMLAAPPDDFHSRITKNKKTVAETLMNQKIISGVGNYIKAEALYLARISPWRKCNSLTEEETNKLYDSIRTVMMKSFRLGGATLATYKNFEGEVGSFNKELQIYKKSSINGMAIIAEETPDKRTTWWCPTVQK